MHLLSSSLMVIVSLLSYSFFFCKQGRSSHPNPFVTLIWNAPQLYHLMVCLFDEGLLGGMTPFDKRRRRVSMVILLGLSFSDCLPWPFIQQRFICTLCAFRDNPAQRVCGDPTMWWNHDVDTTETRRHWVWQKQIWSCLPVLVENLWNWHYYCSTNASCVLATLKTFLKKKIWP